MTKEKEGAWRHYTGVRCVFVDGVYSKYQEEERWMEETVGSNILKDLLIPVELC